MTQTYKRYISISGLFPNSESDDIEGFENGTESIPASYSSRQPLQEQRRVRHGGGVAGVGAAQSLRTLQSHTLHVFSSFDLV